MAETIRLRLTAAVLIGILFAVGMVATTYYASRADLNAIPLPGVPIESSVFAECVSAIPDPAVYPANVAILSQHPLILKYDYDGCRMINEQQAIDQAWRFIRTQLPGVEGLELLHWELWGPEPRWFLLFNGSMNINIEVNALSGKVFECQIQGALNHKGNQSMTEEEATERAIAFLNNCNYTLPEEARYLGIRSIADENGTSEGYEFRFLQYVGSAFVGNHPPSPSSGGNHIEIYVDGRTAMVTRFCYYWVEIPEISLQDVVEPGVAASEVRALFVDNPEVQISNVTLALCTMPSPEFPASGFVITEQLCWIISTAQPSADVYCDAFTGEYTGYSIFYWGGEPVTLVSQPKALSQSEALRITILLIVAMVVATAGYCLSRHRLDQ